MKLRGQLNLYAMNMHPFQDVPATMADPISYWQSKLDSAQELASFALFLYTIPVTEASVERSFSKQKFVETPLRNALQQKAHFQIYRRGGGCCMGVAWCRMGL
jgi:hypothetical protein